MQNWLAQHFDIDLWKKLQDKFSLAVRLPIFTIDSEGNELLVSGEVPYYYKLAVSREQGKRIVYTSRKEQFSMMRANDILFYTDPLGLTNIVAPLTLNGEHIGAIMCACIVQNIRDIARCRQIAEETGIETSELVDALNAMEIRNVQEVRTYGTLLSVLSNTVPELAYQKVKADKRIGELTVLYKISQMINSTLDLGNIMKAVVNFMLQSVQAKTISIVIFEGMKRYSIEETEDDMLLLENTLAAEVAQTRIPAKVHNIANDFRFKRLRIKYNSVVSFPMALQNNVIGIINLYGDAIKFDDADVELLSIIANQTAIAVSNARQYQQIKESAITDKLTGLYNRRHFMETLKNEIGRSQRTKAPISLALFDVDDFKHYNDKNGHLKGDKLLSELGRIIKDSVRVIDTVGRYGGEEFIIVLPETKSHEAQAVAERVRNAIESFIFDAEQTQPMGRVTISMGLVTCMNGTLREEEMIKEADRNMYKSKAVGKNKVTSSIFIDRNMKPVEVVD